MKKCKKSISMLAAMLLVMFMMAVSVLAAGGSGGGSGSGSGGGSGSGTGDGGGTNPLNVVSVTCNDADLSGAEIAPDSVITITFDRGMDTNLDKNIAAITIEGVKYSVVYARKSVFEVTLEGAEPGAYTLVISADATANNGNTLGKDKKVKFTVVEESTEETTEEEITEEETTEEETTEAETTEEETTAEETTEAAAEEETTEEETTEAAAEEETTEEETTEAAAEEETTVEEIKKEETTEATAAVAETTNSETKPAGDVSSPDTGDSSDSLVLYMAAMAGAAYVALRLRKKEG